MSHTPSTIRELAARLGLSTATVSRALRNQPNVSSVTRARVHNAAKTAGYRPSALINALMSQVRSRHRMRPTGEVIAYLTAFENEEHWRTMPSLVAQYEGARERARELGFTLQALWLGDRGSRSRSVGRVLRARGIRGSLLAPLPIGHRVLDLDWDALTVTAIGYSFHQASLHRVVHHNMHAMFTAYARLRQLGYARIGLALHRDDDARVLHLWLSGFLGSQHVYGGARIAPLLFDDYCDSSPFLAWHRKLRPDVVIGIWRHVTLDWMKQAGVAVPEETGFASLDLGNDQPGRIAGILQDNTAVGAAAVDLLTGQLFRNETGIPAAPKATLIEGSWTDGPSAPGRLI